MSQKELNRTLNSINGMLFPGGAQVRLPIKSYDYKHHKPNNIGSVSYFIVFPHTNNVLLVVGTYTLTVAFTWI